MTDYKTLYDAIANLNIPIEKQGKFANDKDLWFEYAHFPYIGKSNQSDTVDLSIPLTFEAKADGTKIYFLSYDGEGRTCSIDVSTDDGQTWTEVTSEIYSDDNKTPIATLDTGEKVLVRGDNPNGMSYYSESTGYAPGGSFYIDGEAFVYGNVMSLLSKSAFPSMTEVPDYAFMHLFSDYEGDWMNASSLFSHPTNKILLPATTLAPYCYSCMFSACKNLTIAPVLPAIKMEEGCYEEMFFGCTSLTSAPELPATTLVSACYNGMFAECSSLNYIKAMFTTTPDNMYTGYWVGEVSATGTFVKNSAATWDVTGNDGIPTGWTVETV